MPRQESVLSVFVASPSDVSDERTRLEEIVRELNTVWRRDLGISLELVKWETNAYPGTGIDAQDVINNQIPDDYDIFLGIMWHRFGTPTMRAASGTMEEFDRAKKRCDANPNSVSILFYFKDEPIAPSKTDGSQVAKIADFKKSLGTEGTLYWNFADTTDFEKLARIHLTRCVQAFHRANSKGILPSAPVSIPIAPTSAPVAEVVQVPSPVTDDDLGTLDLLDIFETCSDDLNEITERLTQAISELGTRISARSTAMADLPRDAKGNADRKLAKRNIAGAASDMDMYTARVSAELPLFSASSDKGMNALFRAIELSPNESPESRNALLESIVGLIHSLTTSADSSTEFKATIEALPPMTSELNKAKRAVSQVTEQLIRQLHSTAAQLTESEKALRGA